MDTIEFDDGGSTPSYMMRDSSAPWMVRMVVKLSGDTVTEKAANYILLIIGIACLLAAFVILRATF